jgi:hypothetical protein
VKRETKRIAQIGLAARTHTSDSIHPIPTNPSVTKVPPKPGYHMCEIGLLFETKIAIQNGKHIDQIQTLHSAV